MQTNVYYWNKLFLYLFLCIIKGEISTQSLQKNDSHEECDLHAMHVLKFNDHVDCDLTLLIQKELHRASRCAVVSEIADFWTGVPESEQSGRRLTDIPEPIRIS
jgi:hypothetical protein